MPSSRASNISAKTKAEMASRRSRGTLEDSLPGPPGSEPSVVFCYVYVLYSDIGGKFYIGFTRNLRQRLAEHQKGVNLSTKAYASSWELVYYEAHKHKADARRRERYLKTTPGHRALKLMLREHFMQKDSHNRRSTTRYA